MNDQSQSHDANDAERPAPRPFPNSDYIRPGIDDRPDLDKALSDEDKAAVARLAVRQKPKTPPAAADQPEVQAAAMGANAPVGGADEPVPDLESAFLDMRDPMVDANGYRPTKGEVLRMKVGFMGTAFFLAFALAALNITLVPQELDALSGPIGGAVALSRVLGVGILCSLVATVFFLPLSDHTRTPFGRRAPWFAAGTIVAVVFAFSLSACHTPAAVGVVWALLQIGLAAMLCALHASIGERVPDKFRDAVGTWRTVGLLVGLVFGIWFGVLMASAPAVGMDLCAIALLAAGIVGLLVIPRESSTVYSRAKPMKTADLLVTLRVTHPTAAWRTICLTRLFASAGVMLTIAYIWFVVRYRRGADAGLDVRATMTMAALMGLLACAMALLSEGVTDLLRASLDNDRLVLMVGVALAIVAAIVPLVSYTPVGLYVFAGIGGFAIHMIDDALQSLAVASVPQIDRAAEYLAVFNTSATVGRLLGVIVGGFVFAYAAVFSSVFLWAAIMFAFAGASGAAAIAYAAKR
ncbi:MFS transporter [Bifidobacterium choerinum]|uniref:Na+/sugar symporter n=1 Tax=Bifidobacterium choerinum TaxID=35760 RepID=A0A087AH43_9BIFI|nr:MFS transporter [Bifidobacterium choerinum]KFI58093.1 Na+/sugar symporter [Bifidobacterium choerinum]